eukprot:m.6920 g.6920  ORF g.6920 m.6920 type:complete len:143 (+) comp17235_c0_seq2:135-563(+)
MHTAHALADVVNNMEEHLRRDVMTNQLGYVAGCNLDEARQLLLATDWHFDAALSRYLQEETIPRRGRSAMNVPANTPETPPYFAEALMAFAKLRAVENMSGSGGPTAASSSVQSSSGNSSDSTSKCASRNTSAAGTATALAN